MKEKKLKDIVKAYSKDIHAKKRHLCWGCYGWIKKGEEYYKVRVKAHIPFSKATRLEPLCIDCTEEYVLSKGANIIDNVHIAGLLT